ncbi:hypothetical protein C8R43DRAFT_1122459 [Mycena crocata]|nr:hypothetical protein C8R43DRAFT_1122459 [Mycena crocata]
MSQTTMVQKSMNDTTSRAQAPESTQAERYANFMLTAREYRHLKLLQRSGRSCDSTLKNKGGEIAWRCPACPTES